MGYTPAPIFVAWSTTSNLRVAVSKLTVSIVIGIQIGGSEYARAEIAAQAANANQPAARQRASGQVAAGPRGVTASQARRSGVAQAGREWPPGAGSGTGEAAGQEGCAGVRRCFTL